VLEDDQPSAGAQDPPCFGERPVRVGDRAQHLGEHHRVEAGIGLAQRLGGVADELGPDRRVGQLGGQPPAHGGVGLGGHHEAGGAEMRQVRSGPGARVEHLAAQVREQAGPPLPEHSLFQRAGHPVVEGGEQPVLRHHAAGPRPG
jgi:hypothetical protein